jgi:hypothetical protein
LSAKHSFSHLFDFRVDVGALVEELVDEAELALHGRQMNRSCHSAVAVKRTAGGAGNGLR